MGTSAFPGGVVWLRRWGCSVRLVGFCCVGCLGDPFVLSKFATPSALLFALGPCDQFVLADLEFCYPAALLAVETTALPAACGDQFVLSKIETLCALLSAWMFVLPETTRPAPSALLSAWIFLTRPGLVWRRRGRVRGRDRLRRRAGILRARWARRGRRLWLGPWRRLAVCALRRRD